MCRVRDRNQAAGGSHLARMDRLGRSATSARQPNLTTIPFDSANLSRLPEAGSHVSRLPDLANHNDTGIHYPGIWRAGL